MPEEKKRRFALFEGKIFLCLKNISLPRFIRPVLAAALLVTILGLLVINFSSVKIDNDLSSMYTISAPLLESEKRAAKVLDYGSMGWYFIVAGASTEETLENEERLTARLEEEITRGNLASFLGTSVFVPSIKKQKETYNSMKALLPLAPAQFENLSFPQSYAQEFENEFTAAATRYCLPEDAPSFAGISKLWIGQPVNAEDCYYSCVLPLKPVDEAVFSLIADEFDSVYFVNKEKDIRRDLNILTGTILLFFLAAYLVVSVTVFAVYPRRDSLKICAVPLLLAMSAMAVLSANKIPLSFFSVAAIVLVFGLGLDYIFYMVGKKHGEETRLTSLAVVLSFLTTLLSFGALVLSSFTPTHIFGLTVSAGLGAAFIFAMLLQDSAS